MVKEGIMSGIYQIPYDKGKCDGNAQRGGCEGAGRRKMAGNDRRYAITCRYQWSRNFEITLTRELLERFDTRVDTQTSKSIFQ